MLPLHSHVFTPPREESFVKTPLQVLTCTYTGSPRRVWMPVFCSLRDLIASDTKQGSNGTLYMRMHICICKLYISSFIWQKKPKYYLLEHSLTWNSSIFLFYILLDHSGVLRPMAVYMHSILSTRLHMPNVRWNLRLSVSQGNLWIPLIRSLILVYSNRREKKTQPTLIFKRIPKYPVKP